MEKKGISSDQIRVFYEIALAIGDCEDSGKMLKNSIITYIRQLNCSGACVVRLKRIDSGNTMMVPEFSLPYTSEVKATFLHILSQFPTELSEPEYLELTKHNYTTRMITEGEYLYIFTLPGFGLLMLTRRSEPFDEEVLSIIQDLNRKLATSAIACIQKQELTESENRYRELTESLPELICETDQFGIVNYVNEYALLKTGYTQEESKNRFSILNVFRLEDHFRITEDLKHCKEQRQQVFSEYEIVRKDGSSFTGAVYINAITKGITVAGFRGVVIDITETKKHEGQLKEYSDRLELALTGSGSGMWDWNITTGHILTHGWYERILGKKEGEVEPTFEAHVQLIHPDDRNIMQAALARHFTDPSQTYSCEYRVRHADGTWKWMLDTGMIIENDSNGKPLRMTGIQLDINQKKLVEEVLIDNLQHQELISEIAISLNNLSDFDTKIEYTLQVMGRQSHSSRTYIFEDDPTGEFTSNTFEWCADGIASQRSNLAYVPYEMVPGWKERLVNDGAIIVSDTAMFSEEIRMVLEPQGILSIVVYPIIISGKYAGFIGIDECVTNREWTTTERQLLKTISGIISNAFERRLTERSLKESFATNRAILASLPDKLLHCNKNGDILNFNFSESDSYFVDKIEKNMNLAQAMPQAQADLFLQSISICIDQGTYNFSFETNTEGLITNFETRLSKVNETEAILLVRDVTLDKYQQDLLRHAIDRAEKANQAKSEFLANMSHEIRTPMNGVIGMASLLSKSVMTEEQREMVDTIRNSGDLLLSIINDILDFSKIESGNMELEKGQIDLRLILEEVTDQFSARLNQKDLYFSYFIDPAIRTIVLGDRIRMHQILVNLIGNAIKFTREGGIEIRVWPGEVVNGKTQINFSILDTGIGIPEDKIQMLFKPFSQLNSSNNRQYTGTGLGLAITARLVKLMDGEIGVTSRANHGSDFHFHVMMDTTEKQDFIESAPVKGIAILNDVDTPWLHHQIDHFLDVVQAARVTEYTQGTLVITDKEQQSYPPENTILTGVTWSFDESAVTSRTLALPLKLSTFLKAISEDRLYCKTKTVEVPDPEDLFSQYPLKILVAEDNRTNQKLMIQTLNYFGYMPGLSKNGQEVLDALKNEHYDLIFMDIQMPEMDGLEATRIVKRTYKTNRPVIIAMTASALMEEKELCFMAGVDDYLSKPAKIENIGDMIHKWGTMILQKRILI